MSPEQARGKGVDERTDIWALGCLLFEMLTGQPAFGGEDVTVTLARILERDPDMTALPVSVSSAVRHTIGMCLRKDVRKRLADTRDFKLSVDGEFVPETAEGGGGRGDGWRSALPFIFGSSLLTGALVAGLAWMRQPEVEPSLPTRFVYDLPDGQEIQGQQGPVLAISSDGRQFVYSTDGGLYVRAMDNLEAKLIPGSESIFDVHTFSPDGRSVAGWGYPGRLTRIATIGGAVVPIADLSAGRDLPGIELYGVDWQIDGTILYTQRDGIYRIAAGGGVPEPLISFEDVTVYGAESLPDGDSVLFSVTETGNWDTAQIVVQSVSTGERTELGLSGSDARYLPTSRSTGHIVYALGTQLFAARFDPQTLRTSSAAVPVLQEVLRAEGGPSGVAHYDVSDNGTLIYISGDVRPKFLRTLVWVDRQGNEQPIDVPPRSYRSPRISPDGAKIALTVRENLPEGDVWTWDIARRTLVPVTAGPGLSRFPAWSRDGEHIAYVWRSILGGAASRLYRLPADGSGNADLLAETPYQLSPPTFLPDDTGLVLSGNVEPGNEDIAIVALAGSGAVEVRPLLTTPLFDEQHPEVSPDGRWLAYTSNESGTDEVWVRPYPNLEGERHLVSAGGGEQPLWSPDGSELFYRSGDAVMVVDVETDPSFRTGDPEALFGGYPIVTQGGRDYDTRDGERFIMMKQVQETSAGTEIIVVENWFGELKRLAPPTP
jgi:hypothetical protein